MSRVFERKNSTLQMTTLCHLLYLRYGDPKPLWASSSNSRLTVASSASRTAPLMLPCSNIFGAAALRDRKKGAPRGIAALVQLLFLTAIRKALLATAPSTVAWSRYA